MLSWSINLFRIRGIQLAVHASFFLLLAYVGFEGWQDGGWIQLLLSMAVLVAFFACVVLHELGHSFTAMHFGIGVRRILLMPIGGMAEFDAIPREPVRELLITLAGPAVNFVIAGLLWAGLLSGAFAHSPGAADFCIVLLQANFFMGCFNLLPAFPMDGGRILRAFLAMRLPYLRATFVAATIGKVICAIGVIVGLVFWDKHPFLPFLFAFIYFAGEAEYRAVQRRELEDAHWREMLRQVYPAPPVTEEPPLLGP